MQHEQIYTNREVAAKLPANEWVDRQEGDAFFSAQTKLELTVTTNNSFEVLGYTTNHEVDDKDFVADLLKVLGPYMCPAIQMRLVEALTKNLVEWQARRGTFPPGTPEAAAAPVTEMLERLKRYL